MKSPVFGIDVGRRLAPVEWVETNPDGGAQRNAKEKVWKFGG
jgi:hypothetical protein